jgi:penicillin-binding protein 2
MLPGKRRHIAVLASTILVGLVFILQLMSMQVISDTYQQKSKQIAKRTVTINPGRGQIMDRNDRLMVYNDLVYDLMLEVPYRYKTLDTLTLCRLFNLTRPEFNEKMATAIKKSYQGYGVFQRNLNDTLQAQLRENMFKLPGFNLENRYARDYKTKVAAHILGFIGEIDRRELDQSEYYEIGDYVGKKGVEKIYEEDLRGVKGRQFFLVDKFGRTIERFAGGDEDIAEKNGATVTLTIDEELQAYAERLLQGKKGSVVAIEPSSGEILVMATSPNYAPEEFSIKTRKDVYPKLLKDPTKPLLNRAVSSSYPPGSIFKTVMSLIALQEGIITPQSGYTCHGGFRLGRRTVACHAHSPYTQVKYAITVSCNSFYCNVWRDLINHPKYESREVAYETWRTYLNRFSIGMPTGTDVLSETAGTVKPAGYYNKLYGEGRWNYSTNISVSIGQGEIGMTPLQMANLAACIANRGYYLTPHLIKDIEGRPLPEKFRVVQEVGIDKKHFETVVAGMRQVLESGTATWSNIPKLEICGKTGTAQNPHGKNHSVFIAFAPMNDPKIAVATIVENAGYGSTYAAPISTLVIDQYLANDSVSNLPFQEEKMLNTQLIDP